MPLNDRNSYLSVLTENENSNRHKLFINKTNENYPRLFTTSQNISHIYYPTKPSELYCPDVNGFIHSDMDTNSRGNCSVWVDGAISPQSATKYYIIYVGMNTCFVFSNPITEDYIESPYNNYLLTTTLDRELFYISSNSLWPNQKLWYIEIYE
jgi:uncharacterized protein YukJ